MVRYIHLSANKDMSWACFECILNWLNDIDIILIPVHLRLRE